MTKELNEHWAAEIAAHLRDRFGLSVREIVPIHKGWLNVKWKMVTGDEPIFVKYYHPDRYKLHTHPERRSAIEKTLQLQQGLSIAGIPCPGVYSYNAQFIQETRSGLFYTVLDWVDGHNAQAGYLNSAQMYELGMATGRMHNWLRFIPPLNKPAWRPDREAYLREWQENWDKAQEAGDRIVCEWLIRSEAIVTTLDFRIFDPCPTGWLHGDLWVDNLLLHEHGLVGIVDFDRMTMAYPEIDVARAILSGSLRDGQIQIESARAFMDGYRSHSEIPGGVLTRAMRMLYLLESIWWLRTEVRAESELRGLLGRFIHEIHWVENNWRTLSEQLDSL
ncbi:phosphotransferase [Paenibacillus glycanilyticus]|uniref:phosphotransferase enzyme family protein n=1 Tax=Paenibacillus glycanilyticus TaxID=126569 RepID=UPI00204028F7|nr:phosphotransferase [Paenibacillus glycanilyticus]MCM3629800.1 phosphotransferase [Paenibacillus glycanilyticus]